MDADMMEAMGITGFGKVVKKQKLDPNRFDKSKRGEPSEPVPEVTTSSVPTKAIQYDHAPEYEFGNDEEPEVDMPTSSSSRLPITHEITLKDHTKVVSALGLDPSGARIASGSHDYDAKLWDFGGMDTRTRPFKSWEPQETHYVHDVKWANDGKRFLVVSGTIQVKMYDRDGEDLGAFVKGDPYIRDMRNTKGHVGELSSCAWHPYDADVFITASADSTVRIWNTTNRREQKTVIVFKSKDRGARTRVTACAYSPDAALIGGACIDGAIQLWATKSNYVRPSLSLENAHTKTTETGSLVFSNDGNHLITRGGDDTVKLWDIRSFKAPVAVRTGLGTLYPGTNAVYSPDETLIVSGGAAETKGGQGKLVFMDSQTLEVKHETSIVSTPVKVIWHPKLNQIITGLSNGEINVLYSPEDSTNGAKLVLSKGPPRKRNIEDVSNALAAPTILTPHALPMFRDEDAGGMKRKRAKDRKDPVKSHRPELPISGPGKGGRVGASATQHVVQNLVRDSTRDEDPREALLKFANREDDEWTKAWAGNAKVYAKDEEEEA